jgi:hypothetical protein
MNNYQQQIFDAIMKRPLFALPVIVHSDKRERPESRNDDDERDSKRVDRGHHPSHNQSRADEKTILETGNSQTQYHQQNTVSAARALSSVCRLMTSRLISLWGICTMSMKTKMKRSGVRMMITMKIKVRIFWNISMYRTYQKDVYPNLGHRITSGNCSLMIDFVFNFFCFG